MELDKVEMELDKVEFSEMGIRRNGVRQNGNLAKWEQAHSQKGGQAGMSPRQVKKIFFHYSALHNLRRGVESVHVFNANFLSVQVF